MSRTSYILTGNEPFRKDPAFVVQHLPRPKPKTEFMGHVVAFLAGIAACIIVLALEGSIL